MGRLIPPESGPIYVDANAMIYRVERLEPYWSASSAIWDALDEGRCEVITSELTLLEVLVKPLREGNATLATLYREVLLTSRLSCIPVNREVLESAASLRASHRLKTADAIHAATALLSGVSIFLTNDSDFRKVEGLNVIILGEVAPS